MFLRFNIIWHHRNMQIMTSSYLFVNNVSILFRFFNDNCEFEFMSKDNNFPRIVWCGYHPKHVIEQLTLHVRTHCTTNECYARISFASFVTILSQMEIKIRNWFRSKFLSHFFSFLSLPIYSSIVRTQMLPCSGIIIHASAFISR